MAKKLVLLVKTKGKTKSELREQAQRLLRKKGMLDEKGRVITKKK